MKATKFLSILLITLLFSSFFFSCQKSSNNPSNPTDQDLAQLTASASAEGEAENTFNGVVDNVFGVNSEVGLGTGIGIFGKSTSTGRPESPSNPCFSVTITPEQPGVYPKTVVIDFGEGCTGPDGHTRKGKMNIVYTGRMIIPGSKATTTFEGFYVDSVHVEGTLIIENNSTSNQRIFTISIEDGKLSKPNGNYILWSKTKTWTQTEGNGTPFYLLDDKFEVTGYGSGTVKRGEVTTQWSAEITEPVIRKFTCRWAVTGTVHITRNNLQGILDFGNGDCDNKATFTAYGHVYEITLP